MKAAEVSGITAEADVIAPKTRRKIGKTTFIIERHYSGGRDYIDAINDVVMNESGRYENSPDSDKMKPRKVTDRIAADPVTERRTEK